MTNWGELADAIIRVTREVGWVYVAGLCAVVLGWKWMDAWGRKPGRDRDP